MDNFFTCPNCEGHLKVGDYLIFSVQASNKRKGLLLLHPEIGNYTCIKHPSFEFDTGDELGFYCPLCQSTLTSDIDSKLVHVQMIDSNNKEHTIYFSRIAGEYSTYKISDDDVMCTGEHAGRYTYFKCSQDLVKYLRK